MTEERMMKDKDLNLSKKSIQSIKSFCDKFPETHKRPGGKYKSLDVRFKSFEKKYRAHAHIYIYIYHPSCVFYFQELAV